MRKKEQTKKDNQELQSQRKTQEQKEGGYDVNFSAEFQDLQETTELETDKNEQKEDPNQRHYIIPGTMFQGQYEYITKEKKEQDVEQQLEQLQDQKRQLEISTQHYVIPATVVEAQIQKGGKELKHEQVEKQLQKIDQNKENTLQDESIKPKIVQRVNMHEFNSNQVPELHQQDIPLNLQPVEVNQNLHTAIEQPKIKTIKPLQPVSLNQSNIQKPLKPVSLTQPKLSNLESQSPIKKKSEQKQRHYIIPGTCFEGQFEYITKQKKEAQIQKQLYELDNEKRQLQIQTEHYVVPSSVTEGQVLQGSKKQKQQIIDKEIQQVDKQNRKLKQAKLQKQIKRDRLNLANIREASQGDTEGMKLLKERSEDKKSIKLQIASDQKGKLPLKIDQYTTMTVISQNEKERPYFNLPISQQQNDDLEIIVIETQLNKQASSPRDLVFQKPKDVLGNQKMPQLIDNLNIKSKDGSPVKVVIGTKQFANYPGQTSPSPPIIDENTLQRMRRKNGSSFFQRPHNPLGIPGNDVDEGNPEEVEIKSLETKQKTSQIVQGNQRYEVKHTQLTLGVDKIKKLEPDNQKKQPFIAKLAKSAIFSSLIGGLVWLGLEDKKFAAISAATGFALALVVQK